MVFIEKCLCLLFWKTNIFCKQKLKYWIIITAENAFAKCFCQSHTQSNIQCTIQQASGILHFQGRFRDHKKQQSRGRVLLQEVDELYLHSLKAQSRILVESFEVLSDERSKTIKFNGRNGWRINYEWTGLPKTPKTVWTA